jgi:leucyl aminopeptidase
MILPHSLPPTDELKMRLTSTATPPHNVDASYLAVGVFDGQDGPPTALAGTPAGEIIARSLRRSDLSGSLGEVTLFPSLAGLTCGALVTFGLGKREKFDPGAAYDSGCALSKRLAAKPRDSVAVVLPETPEPGAIIPAFIEGLIVGTRAPDLKKSERARHAFDELRVVLHPKEGLTESSLAPLLKRSEVVGDAVNLARELANTPPSEKAPADLAARIKQIGEAAGLSVDVWDSDRIRAERFGGLLAVAAGSEQPPAFVVLRYQNADDGAPLALVGKGVTFDSGGLSLKPSASMEDMKADMTGAAVVLAAMQAVARLGAPANLVGYLALTENMTGGRAMKLGDVLTMRNGKTVEVMNTDAEGRLILADALSYASEFQPARILDLATLTGACMVALGTKIAGLFTTDDGFASDLEVACRRSGERVWRMPLDDDFEEGLKSHIADCKNVGNKWGGAVTAAKFLQKFVGGVSWAHLDIAGPSWAENESATRDPGATGCLVRTLVELISPGEAP